MKVYEKEEQTFEEEEERTVERKKRQLKRPAEEREAIGRRGP